MQLVFTSENDVQPFTLYVSNRSYSDGSSFVVVGSTAHASQWRAVLYDKPDESNAMSGRSDGFRAGSCVRLLHLETTSWLRFSAGERKDAMGSGQVNLQYSEDKDVEDESIMATSSDSLWEMERTNLYEGGEITWSDSITFRHVISGKYLAVSPLLTSPPVSARSPVALRMHAGACSTVIAQEHPQSFSFMSTAVADEGCVRSVYLGCVVYRADICRFYQIAEIRLKMATLVLFNTTKGTDFFTPSRHMLQR